MTADQVIGNKIKLTAPVTVWTGYPGSSRTETWGPGTAVRVTPVVYSYVMKSGDVYWEFKGATDKFLKHDASKMDIQSYSGGADYLNTKSDSPSISLGGFTDLLTVDNLDKVLKIGLFGIAGYIGIKIFGMFK